MPEGSRRRTTGNIVRYVALAALVAVVCLEGYYIIMLRDVIRQQSEDLRNISVQLQLLKSEREQLNEEISSVKEKTGDKDNGNISDR